LIQYQLSGHFGKPLIEVRRVNACVKMFFTAVAPTPWGLMSKERRWLVLTANGEHSWLGRHSDPKPDEIEAVKRQLDELGIAGWLAVSEGAYYSRGLIKLLEVRAIGSAVGDWGAAEAAFHTRRRATLTTNSATS
jgi:hypothetical protein